MRVNITGKLQMLIIIHRLFHFNRPNYEVVSIPKFGQTLHYPIKLFFVQNSQKVQITTCLIQPLTPHTSNKIKWNGFYSQAVSRVLLVPL